MGRKLTTEEFKERLFQAVGNDYSLKEGQEYTGKESILIFHCNIHNVDFQKTAECFMRGPNDVRGRCPLCLSEINRKNRIRKKVKCAYCGLEFERPLSKLECSKSGLYFCCREHKDLAQRLDSGTDFDIIRPSHYGNYTEGATSVAGYRRTAFYLYPHKCAICGWDEDEDILQVHHIDENRKNCNSDNLIILCPTCHWKLTLGKYKLVGRNKIVKK